MRVLELDLVNVSFGVKFFFLVVISGNHYQSFLKAPDPLSL